MLVKPIKKPKPLKKGKKKLTSQQKKTKLKKEADRLLQEVGRKIYGDDGCLVCRREYSCLHHYHTKGCCSALRYDWANLIPICAGCHNRHHKASDPRVHNEINRIKGQDWVDDLEWKRCNLTVKTSMTYYTDIINNLNILL